MQHKIFTFHITYQNVDEFNCIQFCTETKEEAIELFNEWCKTDKHINPVPIESIEVIYNKYDAEEYNENYGTPEEYNKLE